MRLWSSPEGVVPSGRSSFRWQPHPISSLTVTLWLILLPVDGAWAITESEISLTLAQRAKAASPYIGSAMAVLATLQQAAVLPPEGTREADRIIQAVIQLQSVFAKGTDPSIQEFARRALATKRGEDAATSLEHFRAGGWTADMLEALADADSNASPDERKTLATGLGQFNLSVDDFRRFMQLVRDGRSALTAQGLAFEEVYTHHRSTMPGAAR